MAIDNSVHQGWRIPLFTKRELFSAKALNNRLVEPLQALVNLEVSRGGSDGFYISKGKAIIKIAQGGAGQDNSGGTNTLKQYKIATNAHGLADLRGDYIVCNEWDNVSIGASANIALWPLLRYSLSSRAYYPDTCTYTYPDPTAATNVTDQQTRNVSVNSVASGTEILNPRYLAGDIIYGMTVDHTGVTVSGTELTIIEAIASRDWVYSAGQTA